MKMILCLLALALLGSCVVYLAPNRCDSRYPTCPALPGATCDIDLGLCVTDAE